MAKLDIFSKQSKQDKIIDQHSKEGVYDTYHGSVHFMQHFILPILVFYSGSVSLLFVFFNILKMTNSFFYAFVGGLMIVLIIEGIKLKGLKSFISQLLNGSMSKGHLAIFLTVTIGIITVLCYAGSVYLAIEGSPLLATHITNAKNEIQLIDLEQTNKRYDSELAVQDKSKNKAYSNTWKGKVTDEALSAGRQIEKTKQQINEARLFELNAAKEMNDRKLQEHDSFTSNWGGYLSKFGGYTELLEFLIILLICFFERAVYIERPDLCAAAATTSTVSHAAPVATTGASTHRQIGFAMQGKPEYKKQPLQTFTKVVTERDIGDVEREIGEILRAYVTPYISHVKQGNVRASTGRSKYLAALESITILETEFNVSESVMKNAQSSLLLLDAAIKEKEGSKTV